jgi:hypothetical protein
MTESCMRPIECNAPQEGELRAEAEAIGMEW